MSLSCNEHANREDSRAPLLLNLAALDANLWSVPHIGQLTVRKELLIPTEQETTWAPEPAWML